MKTTAMHQRSQPLAVILYLPLALYLLLGITMARASTGTDGILVQLRADDLQVVQAGEVVYQQHCAACHGAQLEGQPDWRSRSSEGLLPAPPHDASGHTWHHADDLLFEITKYGASVVINDPDYRSAMPVYKDILSDEQIIAVLSFIKNSWPDEERQWQEETNANQTEALLPKRKGSSFLERFSQ
ncbi:c-type cytochrome [Granulosicoccus sp. 3-233]|uniref:c-type cytochrome n=1 Tax=Granulosicoccus sp. 3-233 TaxID=3417969 RepID=UPI003D340FD4